MLVLKDPAHTLLLPAATSSPESAANWANKLCTRVSLSWHTSEPDRRTAADRLNRADTAVKSIHVNLTQSNPLPVPAKL